MRPINLLPEFQILYDLSRKQRLTSALYNPLRSVVRSNRATYRSTKSDLLQERVAAYGNSGGWSREQLSKLVKRILEAKCPDESDLGSWVSVELEFIMPHKTAEASLCKYIRGKGYGKYCTLKDDGSVRPTTEHEDYCCVDECSGQCEQESCERECSCGNSSKAYGKELVVTFKRGDAVMLHDICKTMVSMGCSVNKTCGTHVHYDMRHVSSNTVETMAIRVAGCVTALKQLLPPSRQNNTYCQDSINCINGGNRYSFVNLQAYKKHQTLEIRGHSGTLDATKLVNWIDLVHTIMVKRAAPSAVNAINLIEKFNLNPELAAYIHNRYNKFNGAKEVESVDDIAADSATDAGQLEMPVTVLINTNDILF